ncbi:MAG: tetratricopeptide repeat protein [Muribaculaceae bacterium]
MEINVNNLRNNVIKMLRDNRIYEALLLLEQLIKASENADIAKQFSRTFNSYKYLLQYYSRGFGDPQRNEQINSIVDSIYTLTDHSVALISEKTSTKLYYIRRSNRVTDLSDTISRYRNINESISYIGTEPENSTSLVELYEKRESLEKDIFHHIWTSFPAPESFTTTISDLLKDPSMPVYAREMMVGALLLSLLTFYEESKMLMLIETYATHEHSANAEERQLALKALVCLVIAVFRHHNRASTSTPLKQRIALLSERGSFVSDLTEVFLNLVRAKNADGISKSLQDSIIPDIMKIAPDIINKAKFNNGVIDLASLEDNPDWMDLFDKSGLSKKLEEFGKLQTSGSDVFYSTFAHLKNYAFFRELYNWFRPYHSDNSTLTKLYYEFSPSISKMIGNATYLCDNDRYSFALSLKGLNESQREMMLQQLDTRGSEMQDENSETNANAARRHCINNYVKDLYRFFTLFSRRSEFANVFQSSLNLFKIELFGNLLRTPSIMNAVADIYFSSKQYTQAIEYLNMIAQQGNADDITYEQKLGYAYQNTANHALAIEHYEKYLLANDGDTWTMKRIAACYRALNRHSEAIPYLQKAMQKSPKNTQLSLALGHCYTATGQLQDALKEYYKVEYLNDNQHSAWRPLAWCLFLMRDFEKSRSYYQRIFSDDTPTEPDYLNFGHLCLLENRFEEAITYYYNVYVTSGNSIETFATKWRNDIPNLIKAGLNSADAELMLDAIMMRISNQL